MSLRQVDTYHFCPEQFKEFVRNTVFTSTILGMVRDITWGSSPSPSPDPSAALVNSTLDDRKVTLRILQLPSLYIELVYTHLGRMYMSIDSGFGSLFHINHFPATLLIYLVSLQ